MNERDLIQEALEAKVINDWEHSFILQNMNQTYPETPKQTAKRKQIWDKIKESSDKKPNFLVELDKIIGKPEDKWLYGKLQTAINNKVFGSNASGQRTNATEEQRKYLMMIEGTLLSYAKGEDIQTYDDIISYIKGA